MTIDVRSQDLTIRNKFRYVKKSCQVRVFQMDGSYYDDFTGMPIVYDSAGVTADPVEFSLNVTTDIEFIRDCVDKKRRV